MALLVDATYLSPEEFLSMYGTSSDISSDQLPLLLAGASAEADGIMRRTLLATEVLEYFTGNGGPTISLDRRPICYVSQIAFAQPGLAGYPIARQNVLIDYDKGIMRLYQPIVLQGLGYQSVWPMNVQVAIRYAYGYGYQVQPPAWTAADTPGYGYNSLFLLPGQYDVAITAATPWGETTATPRTITTVSGAISVYVQTTLGAERYRVYIRANGSSLPFLLAAEVPATTFSQGQITAAITSISPLDGNVQQTLPEVDTSMHAIPAELKQAVYWLAMDAVGEINNPANSGIVGDVDLKFAAGGQFSKGLTTNQRRATALLEKFKLNAIYTA